MKNIVPVLLLTGYLGSGKTTLLNILAALDKPTSGRVCVAGKDLTAIRDKDRAEFRRNNLGFIFQDFNLLDNFSIEDNIMLPLVLAGEDYKTMRVKLFSIASSLAIDSLLKKYPYEVSGGQKQRAAVARALITNPSILLADEPTGALDSKSSTKLLEQLREINKTGQTILMVTHSTKAASHAKRVLFIRDGEVFHQLYRASQTSEEMYQKISDALTMIATGGGKDE